MGVPIKVLLSVLNKRKAEAFRAQELVGEHKDTFNRMLVRAADEHRVHENDILGNNKAPIIVEARWQLYSLLYERRWSINAIAGATGHDRNRVRNGLRAKGCIPPAKSKEAAA